MIVNEHPTMQFLQETRPFTMLFGFCALLSITYFFVSTYSISLICICNGKELLPTSKDILVNVLDHTVSFFICHKGLLLLLLFPSQTLFLTFFVEGFEDAINLAYFQLATLGRVFLIFYFFKTCIARLENSTEASNHIWKTSYCSKVFQTFSIAKFFGNAFSGKYFEW